MTPPANDNFADATVIGSVPYSDHPDLVGAGSEASEPAACVGSAAPTVWYAFTPTETNSYAIDRSGGWVPVAVYTGSGLLSLDEVACATGSTAIFRAEAGRTYYLQVARAVPGQFIGEVSLRVAPPAQARFFYYPSDPSVFDHVWFHETSWDPAGIASRLWGFGDGATAADCCPSHRYAADGAYAAKLALTTTDGRTATTTQTITVKTHDVSIAKLSVPKSARVGQSRQISVGVANTRYAETVEVTLLRSVGNGFEPVGHVTQRVPARARSHPTMFDFGYTIVPDDATRGSVTFQAIATILGARDASTTDNTVIAVPTTVTR